MIDFQNNDNSIKSKAGNIDSIIEMLMRCEYPKETEVKELCDKAKEILFEESNVQILESPITVNILFRFVVIFMGNLMT